MQRAWATAKLRRSGVPVNPQTIRRLLFESAPLKSVSAKYESQPLAAKVEPFPGVPPDAADLDVERKVRELCALLKSERARRELAESQAEKLKTKAAELDRVWEDAVKHRDALEESRKREHDLQHQLEALRIPQRRAQLKEREVENLRGQLAHAQAQIQALSNRVEPSKLDALLKQAEQHHLQQQEQWRAQANQREEALSRRITELEALLAGEQKAVAELRSQAEVLEQRNLAEVEAARSAMEKISGLEENLQESAHAATSMQQQIEELTNNLAEREAALAVSEAAREALETAARNLAAQQAALPKHDLSTTLESRRILVDTLEAELSRLRKQQEQFSKMPKAAAGPGPGKSGQADPWGILHDQITRRIELLQNLVAESLLFLRQNQEAATESQDQQPDQQEKDRQP